MRALLRCPRALLLPISLVLALVAGPAAGPGPAGAQGPRAARLRSMGQAYLAAGDPGSAMAYFRDAIAASPRDAESHVLLGEIYLAQGRVPDALAVLSSGLAARPDHGPLWRALGNAYSAQGDDARAAAALRELTERLPEDWEGHLARARLARERRAHAESLASYRALVDLSAAGAPLPAEVVDEARRYGAALGILLGDVDPVAGPSRCADESAVRRALAGC